MKGPISNFRWDKCKSSVIVFLYAFVCIFNQLIYFWANSTKIFIQSPCLFCKENDMQFCIFGTIATIEPLTLSVIQNLKCHLARTVIFYRYFTSSSTEYKAEAQRWPSLLWRWMERCTAELWMKERWVKRSKGGRRANTIKLKENRSFEYRDLCYIRGNTFTQEIPVEMEKLLVLTKK